MNAPSATTTVTTFDLDAALDEASVAMQRIAAQGRDTKALTMAEREATLAGLSRALGLNPLTNAVRFIALQGGEALYVTRQGTDQIAARLRINRETIVGPEIRDIGGVKLVFCQVRASEPGRDGRSDVATATIPLKDPANDLMKCETKAKRRAVLSLVGLGLLTEDDAEGALASDGAAPQSASHTDATTAWLEDLAHVGRVCELRAVYASHAQGMRVSGRDGRHDVRAWLRARGLLAIDAEVTAVLSTLTEGLAEALEMAALEPSENPEPKPDADAVLRAARKVRAVVADEHSTKTAWTILARSYAEATGTTLRDAASTLRDACTKPDPDDTPPTGTDGPRSPQGDAEAEGRDDAGFEAHRAANGATACLRIVTEESSDPLVTSAAAWRRHLAAKHSPWEIRSGFMKRRSAFDAEGVLDERETTTFARLRELGIENPRGLVYPTPKDQAA